jgi:hypothetical protein
MLSKVSFPVAEESGALGAPVVSPLKHKPSSNILK